MYRLHYQTRGGFWCVQFAVMSGLYWETVCADNKKPMRFETLAQAQKYATDSGISSHYRQLLPYQSPASAVMKAPRQFDGRDGNGYQPITYAESNGQL